MLKGNAKMWRSILLYLCFAVGFIYAGHAFAADTDLTAISGKVKGTLGVFYLIITYISYLAGMGFALAAILKFKQHKDNPQSVQIGVPVALVFIAAALLALPTIFRAASTSLFGSADANPFESTK